MLTKVQGLYIQRIVPCCVTGKFFFFLADFGEKMQQVLGIENWPNKFEVKKPRWERGVGGREGIRLTPPPKVFFIHTEAKI